MSREVALQVLEVEAKAIRNLMENLPEEFDRAVDLIAGCAGRVVFTGLGKSGIICRKIAATMSSTGTAASTTRAVYPALFGSGIAPGT